MGESAGLVEDRATAAVGTKVSAAGWVAEGLEHHRAGRLPEASACYAAALRIDPGHADGLNLSGVLARQRGDLSVSERLITKAIQRNGAVATYHHNLARTKALQGRVNEAVESFGRALKLNDRDAESLQMLAEILVSRGAFAEAVDLYQRLLALKPGEPAVYFRIGTLHKVCGEMKQALRVYRRAASLFPANADAAFNLAMALFEANRKAEAVEYFEAVLEARPDDSEAYNCLGLVHHELLKTDLAKEAYLNALRVRPDFPEALSNLGALLMDMGELELSEALVRRAIGLMPELLNAHCNLGNVLARRGDAVGAIESLRRVLAVDPRHAEALCAVGFLLDKMGDEAGALECFQMALEMKPESPLNQFNLSSHTLAAGKFAEGWRQYERRWEVRQFKEATREFARPRWKGEDLRGASIYVYAEQGLGDTIHFARYVPLLVQRGAKVILEVQPLLLNLLRGLHPEVRVVAGRAEVSENYEWVCPLMSLPGIFGTDLSNIPGTGPYLFAQPSLVEAWAQRVAGETLRVGLVWSGSTEHTRDHLRSMSLQQFERVLALPGTSFYSMQKGNGAAQLQRFGERVVDLGRELMDFTDTSAVIANLDLVITVDTSVAHLAAAMGKPTWILLHHAPDWRWLRGRTDSPWYPTVRLFTQTSAGRWEDVLERIVVELGAVVASRMRR